MPTPFADNAIGFFLALDASSFKDEASSAYSDYSKTVTAFDKLNEKLNVSFQDTFDALLDRIDAVASAPNKIVRAYKTARDKLSTAIEPIEQPIEFVFSTKVINKMVKKMAMTLSDLLENTTLRLSAAMPKRRSPIFENDALRSAYANMVQPPDFRGRFELPKFAQGGPVNGPANTSMPGVDNILALLTEGEYVLSSDIAKSLDGLGAKLRGGNGRFVSKSKISEEAANLSNYTKVVARANETLGIMYDPALAAKRDAAVEMLNASWDSLTTTLGDANDKSRMLVVGALAPMLKQAQALLKPVDKVSEAVEDVAVAVTQCERAVDRADGLTDMISDVRDTRTSAGFLALATAFDQMTNSFGGVTMQASMIASATGGEDSARSVITDVNSANAIFGYSKEQKNKVKSDIYDMGRDLSVMPKLVSDAYKALGEAGARGGIEESLRGVTAITAAALETGAGDFAKFNYTMSQTMGMSADQLADYAANVQQLTQQEQFAGAASLQENMQIITKLAEDQSGGFAKFTRDLSDEQRGEALKNISSFTTGMTSQFAMTGDQAGELLTRMFSGSPEEQMRIAQWMNMSTEGMKEAFKTKSGTEQLAQTLEDKLKSLPRSAEALSQVNEILQTGMDLAQLQRVQDGTADLDAATRAAGDSAIKAGQGMATLNKLNERNKTTFERVSIAATNYMATLDTKHLATYADKLGMNGVGGELRKMNLNAADVFDTINDVNPAVMLSGVYLGRMALNAGLAATKMALLGGKSVVSGIMSIPGALMGGMRSVSRVATAIPAGAGGGGGAAAGGFLRGLAGGIGAFAAPPVIVGVGVITAATSALVLVGAAAVRIAGSAGTDAIEAVGNTLVGLAGVLGDVVKFGIGTTATVISGAVDKFMSFDGAKMRSAGLGMLGLGVGLGAFVAATAAAAPLGPVMMVGMPVLYAAVKIAEKLNVGGLAESAADQTNRISEGFSKVKGPQALAAIPGIIGAMGMFAGIAVGSAAMTIAGTVVAVSEGLNYLLDIDAKMFGNNASLIAETTDRISEPFSKIDGKRALSALPGVLGAVGMFVGIGIGAAAMTIAGTAVAVSEGLNYLVGIDAKMFADNAVLIATTTDRISEPFSKINGTQALQAVPGVLAAVGMFIAIGVGTAVQSWTGIISRVADVTNFLTGDAFMTFGTRATEIATSANLISEGFGKVLIPQAKTAIPGIIATGGLLVSFAALSALNVGTTWVSAISGAFNSLGSVAAYFLADSPQDIAADVNRIAEGFDNVKLEKMAGFQRGMDATIAVLTGYTTLIAKADAIPDQNTARGKVEGAVGKAAAIVRGFVEGGAYLQHQFNTGTFDSVLDKTSKIMGAASNGITASANLQLDMGMPSVPEIQSAVQTYVRGSVDAADTQTHALLRQLIELISKQQAPGAPAGGAPSIGDATAQVKEMIASSMANGGI